MKKLIYLIMSLLLIGIVFAQTEQPGLLSTVQLESVTGPPVAPGTGDGTSAESECTPFDVRNSVCSGDFRQYEQCMPVLGGGVWTPKSDDCTQDFAVVCSDGACVREEDLNKIAGIDTQTLIIVGLILFVLIILFRRKK